MKWARRGRGRGRPLDLPMLVEFFRNCTKLPILALKAHAGKAKKHHKGGSGDLWHSSLVLTYLS